MLEPSVTIQPNRFVLENQQHLNRVSGLFQAFRAIEKTMPIQIAYTFILIATHEGASIGDIARLAGFSLSTCSRHILDLGEFNRKKEPGYNLVETRINPLELRAKTVHLTALGRELLRKIVTTMKV